MKILVINNDGGGFADHVEVTDGLTVRELFQKQIPGGKPESYLIRVNRQPAASDQDRRGERRGGAVTTCRQQLAAFQETRP